MRKIFLWVVLITASISTYAVPAYLYPIKYKQPDGTEITIQLKGDERVHWAETSDGYTLLSNGKNGWEYATTDEKGDLKTSGVLASEAGKRTVKELNFLKRVNKKNSFSQKQINILKSVWNARNHSDNLIGTGQFFKQGQSQTTNDGRRKVFSPNGTKKLLMILIGFTDKAFTKTREEFDNLMNTQNYSLNGAHGSVKDYFKEISYNNFTITTDVAGPYTADYDMAHYGATGTNGAHDTNAKALMTEAVKKADPDVDYSQYDNDNDGSVDGVYVIYAGYGEATSGITDNIWPHAGNIETLTLDNKTVSKYSCSNELEAGGNNLTTIGVICHEFGHVCGAPDYYDTNYEDGGQFTGTGRWDLMSGGVYCGIPSGSRPSHFNPNEKFRAGWLTPIVLTETATITVPDISTNATVYKYNTTSPGEYFLIENRQQTGFNTNIPGHGLMIYRYNNYEASGTTRNKTHPQGFYPVCASSVTAIPNADPTSYGNINSSGTPFPGTSGKKAFYDAGTPSSKSWLGENTNMPITNITENANGTVSFTITKPTTCGSEPTTQATAFIATPSDANSLGISWGRGNGDKVLVVASATKSVDFDPLNGTAYTANASFKTGTELGNGNFVVYDGTGTSTTITNLYGNSEYFFAVYEYNSSTNCYLKPALTGSGTTNCNFDPLTFTEDFERSTFGCWTVVDNTGQGNWQIGTTSNVNYTPGLTGNYVYFKSEYNVAHNYNADLISPTFNLSAYSGVTLKFKHLFDRSGSNPSTGTVSYSADNGITWSSAASYSSADSPNPESVVLNVNGIAGKSQVKFKWNYSCSPTGAYMWAIDDIQVIDNSNYWTGSISTDWHTAGNWSTGSIPNSSTTVFIPSAPVNQPQINAYGALSGDITILNGATLTMNASTEYTLSVSGNWTNNGSFTAGKSIVEFNGTNDLQTISGTSLTTFNILKITKGSQNRILEVTSLIALSGSSNPLVLTSGTFKLSSVSTITPFTSAPTIGSTAGLWNNGGTVNSSGISWIVDGALFRLTSGTINISGSNSLQYMNNGKIEIEEGQLNIGRGIRGNSETSIGNISISGGNTTLRTSTSTSEISFYVNPNASLNWTGGTVVVQQIATGATEEIKCLANTHSITGGTLQIGNGSTPVNKTFRINSTVPIYNLVVNGTNAPTAKLLTNLTVTNNVTIQSGGKLVVSPAKQFTVNGTFTNNTGNAGFVLESDVTGTATYLENLPNTVRGTINQYLPTVRNWYMASPVEDAIAPASATYFKYVEASNNGTTWTAVNQSTQLEKMIGYVVKPSTAATTIAFAGTLNSGAQSITTLTSSASAKVGFNLVGNPYPSYLNWTAATKTNLSTTIWYRTQNIASSYVFDTYNQTANIGTNNNGIAAVTGKIPPMQAFWVKVNAWTTGTLAFDNSIRSHQDNASNVFRAPAANNPQQLIRLKVTKGTNSDEAIVLFNSSAKDGFDDFDSPKMINGNSAIPELYSFAENEKLVINGLNNISTNQIVPLGFVTGTGGTGFSIAATEVTSFDSDIKILLKDKLMGVEHELTVGTPYTFDSEATTANNRFSILFRSPSLTTNVDNVTEAFAATVYRNNANQIVVKSMDVLDAVSVYNATGQKLIDTSISGTITVIDQQLKAGVYLVKMHLDGKCLTKKIRIN